MTLNLTHLRAFLTVVEEGSINRAAARLLRAQPAVGRQIKLLEESFGQSLLERSSAGVQPTAAGLMLVEHARLIFQDIARAEAAMAAAGQEPAGAVTVAIPSSLVEQLSTRLFGEVKARYPLIKLNLMEGDSHAVAGWMREQRADLALLPDGGQDLSLHSMACATQTFCFCGNADSFDTLPESIALADALAYPLALTMQPNRLRRLIDTAASHLGCEVQSVVDASTSHVVTLLLREQSIYTIRPRIGPVPVIVNGIAYIPIREPAISRSVSAVWSTAVTLSPAVEATRQCLLGCIRELEG